MTPLRNVERGPVSELRWLQCYQSASLQVAVSAVCVDSAMFESGTAV